MFGAPGLLNAEAGATLPFQGVAAVLEYVLAAGEVCTVGGFLSTASLGNKHAVLLSKKKKNDTQRDTFSAKFLSDV